MVSDRHGSLWDRFAHDRVTIDIGEVWANLLHNVYAALVGVHGFSATAHTDPT